MAAPTHKRYFDICYGSRDMATRLHSSETSDRVVPRRVPFWAVDSQSLDHRSPSSTRVAFGRVRRQIEWHHDGFHFGQWIPNPSTTEARRPLHSAKGQLSFQQLLFLTCLTCLILVAEQCNAHLWKGLHQLSSILAFSETLGHFWCPKNGKNLEKMQIFENF